MKALYLSGVLFVMTLFVLPFMVETVKPVTEATETLFGHITGTVLEPGLHIVNPLASWDHYSNEQNSSAFEDVEVPAADQQKANMDISIQWSLLPGSALSLRRNVGTFGRSYDVLFVPHVRSILRDAGRDTKRVEDFFHQETVATYKRTALKRLQEALSPHGMDVTAVLVRNVTLPAVIRRAIDAKKVREQEVEQERASLEKATLEFERGVREANAQFDASIFEAKGIRVLADAEAYRIQKVRDNLNPLYVRNVLAEGWDGVLPMYMTGDSPVPFVNVQGVDK